MPNYECPRCGYSTKIKTHMRNHFNRQVTCTVVNKNLNISQCYKLVLGEDLPNISKNSLILPENCLKNNLKIPDLPENSLILPENSLILPEKSGNIRNYKKKSEKKENSAKKSEIKLRRRKPVQCPFCNKYFSRKDNLKVHIENSCRGYITEENENENSETNDTIINLKNQLDYEKKLREKDREHILELKKQVEMLLDKVGDTYNTNTY